MASAARGRTALASYGCGGCRTIAGVAGARGAAARDFADRHYVAGRLANEPEHLVRWARDPHAVSPGTAMPDLRVPEPAARDMAAYLYTLGVGGLGAPHLLPKEWLPEHWVARVRAQVRASVRYSGALSRAVGNDGSG